MHAVTVLKVLGVLLALFSSTLLPPLIIALWSSETTVGAFGTAWAVTLVTGLACWWPVRRATRDLTYRDGFLIVVLFWTVLTAFGSLPFMLSPEPVMSVTDSFFESMSGITTTGATVLTGIDELPLSVRYYRQQLQWLGGMGIIVLAVAVMPMLGVGGMQLYRAETPGPVKDTKLTPRITQTAKALWFLYLGLTVLCAVSYWAAGMTLFDAVSHSFSTVAIGGFSTHDASLGYFNSTPVYATAVVFMFLSGINFALHFSVWRARRIELYLMDPEVRTYAAFLGAGALITVAVLEAHTAFDTTMESIVHGVFQVVSIGTTTGFTSTGFDWWPTLLPVMLIIMSAVGGCATSTAGGIKVIRVVLLYKQGRREINRLIHPSAIMPIKLGGKPVADNVINAVWGFFALYVLSYVVLSLAVSATGLDYVTAFSAVTACLNNLGPGLGEAAGHYGTLNDTAKWLLAFAMLLGRLELFTLLVLFTHTFWRG
jgi:trk system potassium uptake protein TrkH